MGIWLITATQITNYELEVEADSYDEAIAEAQRTSEQAFDEFFEAGYEFTIDDAEEVD